MLGKIQYILGERKITVLDSVYTDRVELSCLVPVSELGSLKAELIEGTSGQARLLEGDGCYFADIDGEIKILEK